ncbi:MAG: hypothetical protein OK422_06250 [Thaumarchaeota archaeon]|nr:hypothetical protein [Nitrososphaerota archaeon]
MSGQASSEICSNREEHGKELKYGVIAMARAAGLTTGSSEMRSITVGGVQIPPTRLSEIGQVLREHREIRRKIERNIMMMRRVA